MQLRVPRDSGVTGATDVSPLKFDYRPLHSAGKKKCFPGILFAGDSVVRARSERDPPLCANP
jgi:hypothetical protein